MTVIIPAYNCDAFVAEAVRSALEQDYQYKEVIVVNDGSTDGTLAVLKTFGDAIRIIDQPNAGPPRARNAGLRAARGDYIAFLDGDDVWLQGKLSMQVAHLESHRDVGTCYTGWHVWAPGADGRFSRPQVADPPELEAAVVAVKSGWIYSRLLFDCELLTTTVMIRASVARAVGEFDEKLFCGEDYDLWIRLSREAQISRLNCTGSLYRVLPNSASRRPHATNFEHLVIHSALQRFGAVGPDGQMIDRTALRQRLDGLVFQHGYLHLRRGDPQIALRSFGENLRLDPLRPKLWWLTLSALAKVARSKGASGFLRE